MTRLTNKNYNTIFISATNHYEGTENHGLWQLFLFLQEKAKIDCAFLCTQERYYNHKDCYDISMLGENIPLHNQISAMVYDPTNPNSWKHEAKMFMLQDFSKLDSWKSEKIDNILEHIPKHKNIILGDKCDINEYLLAKIMNKYDSNVIFVTMVHNNNTGFCSYPTEHSCEKYKYEEGCYNCPASIKPWVNLIRYNIEYSRYPIDYNNFVIQKNNYAEYAFEYHKKFLKEYTSKVRLNVGSSFSKKQSDESYLYKNIEKILIPLKNIEKMPKNITHLRKEYKKKFLNSLKSSGHKNISEKTKIFLWSAFEPTSYRKGLHLYIDIMHILKKKYLSEEEFNNILFVISGKENKIQVMKRLFPTNRIVCTGLLDRDRMTNLYLSSDLYCCTTLEDAGPRTVGEAVACGSPVVSFDRCIAGDLITESNGNTIESFNLDAYAEAMSDVFHKDEREMKKMQIESIKAFDEFYDDDKIISKWREALL